MFHAQKQPILVNAVLFQRWVTHKKQREREEEEEEQVFIEAKDNKRTIWTVLAIPTPNISHNVNNSIVKVYTYVYNIFTM